MIKPFQAIVTRYEGDATSRAGARIAVRAPCGRLTVRWDHTVDDVENHARAAQAFITKYKHIGGWAGAWFMGRMPDGYCFVVGGAEHPEAAFVVRDPHFDVGSD